jgi:hypothetical protein
LTEYGPSTRILVKSVTMKFRSAADAGQAKATAAIAKAGRGRFMPSLFPQHG